MSSLFGGIGELQPSKVVVVRYGLLILACIASSQGFPSYSSAQRAPTKGSALEKIKARRAALKARQNADSSAT